MADDTRLAPQPWLAAIEAGLSDIAAGRTYDLDEVIRELEAEDAAMDEELAHEQDGPSPGL